MIPYLHTFCVCVCVPAYVPHPVETVTCDKILYVVEGHYRTSCSYLVLPTVVLSGLFIAPVLQRMMFHEQLRDPCKEGCVCDIVY